MGWLRDAHRDIRRSAHQQHEKLTRQPVWQAGQVAPNHRRLLPGKHGPPGRGQRESSNKGSSFPLLLGWSEASVPPALSGGVTVAQLPLEEFVMVRIHAGQPTSSAAFSPREATESIQRPKGRISLTRTSCQPWAVDEVAVSLGGNSGEAAGVAGCGSLELDSMTTSASDASWGAANPGAGG